jgi:hypothetical protein
MGKRLRAGNGGMGNYRKFLLPIAYCLFPIARIRNFN